MITNQRDNIEKTIKESIHKIAKTLKILVEGKANKLNISSQKEFTLFLGQAFGSIYIEKDDNFKIFKNFQKTWLNPKFIRECQRQKISILQNFSTNNTKQKKQNNKWTMGNLIPFFEKLWKKIYFRLEYFDLYDIHSQKVKKEMETFCDEAINRMFEKNFLESNVFNRIVHYIITQELTFSSFTDRFKQKELKFQMIMIDQLSVKNFFKIFRKSEPQIFLDLITLKENDIDDFDSFFNIMNEAFEKDLVCFILYKQKLEKELSTSASEWIDQKQKFNECRRRKYALRDLEEIMGKKLKQKEIYWGILEYNMLLLYIQKYLNVILSKFSSVYLKSFYEDINNLENDENINKIEKNYQNLKNKYDEYQKDFVESLKSSIIHLGDKSNLFKKQEKIIQYIFKSLFSNVNLDFSKDIKNTNKLVQKLNTFQKEEKLLIIDNLLFKKFWINQERFLNGNYLKLKESKVICKKEFYYIPKSEKELIRIVMLDLKKKVKGLINEKEFQSFIINFSIFIKTLIKTKIVSFFDSKNFFKQSNLLSLKNKKNIIQFLENFLISLSWKLKKIKKNAYQIKLNWQILKIIFVKNENEGNTSLKEEHFLVDFKYTWTEKSKEELKSILNKKKDTYAPNIFYDFSKTNLDIFFSNHSSIDTDKFTILYKTCANYLFDIDSVYNSLDNYFGEFTKKWFTKLEENSEAINTVNIDLIEQIKSDVFVPLIKEIENDLGKHAIKLSKSFKKKIIKYILKKVTKRLNNLTISFFDLKVNKILRQKKSLFFSRKKIQKEKNFGKNNLEKQLEIQLALKKKDIKKNIQEKFCLHITSEMEKNISCFEKSKAIEYVDNKYLGSFKSYKKDQYDKAMRYFKKPEEVFDEEFKLLFKEKVEDKIQNEWSESFKKSILYQKIDQSISFLKELKKILEINNLLYLNKYLTISKNKEKQKIIFSSECKLYLNNIYLFNYHFLSHIIKKKRIPSNFSIIINNLTFEFLSKIEPIVFDAFDIEYLIFLINFEEIEVPNIQKFIKQLKEVLESLKQESLQDFSDSQTLKNKKSKFEKKYFGCRQKCMICNRTCELKLNHSGDHCLKTHGHGIINIHNSNTEKKTRGWSFFGLRKKIFIKMGIKFCNELKNENDSFLFKNKNITRREFTEKILFEKIKIHSKNENGIFNFHTNAYIKNFSTENKYIFKNRLQMQRFWNLYGDTFCKNNFYTNKKNTPRLEVDFFTSSDIFNSLKKKENNIYKLSELTTSCLEFLKEVFRHNEKVRVSFINCFKSKKNGDTIFYQHTDIGKDNLARKKFVNVFKKNTAFNIENKYNFKPFKERMKIKLEYSFNNQRSIFIFCLNDLYNVSFNYDSMENIQGLNKDNREYHAIVFYFKTQEKELEHLRAFFNSHITKVKLEGQGPIQLEDIKDQLLESLI